MVFVHACARVRAPRATHDTSTARGRHTECHCALKSTGCTRSSCTPAQAERPHDNSTDIEDTYGKRHVNSLLVRRTRHPHHLRAARARPRQCRRQRGHPRRFPARQAKADPKSAEALAERDIRHQTAHRPPSAPPARLQLDRVGLLTVGRLLLPTFWIAHTCRAQRGRTCEQQAKKRGRKSLIVQVCGLEEGRVRLIRAWRTRWSRSSDDPTRPSCRNRLPK